MKGNANEITAANDNGIVAVSASDVGNGGRFDLCIVNKGDKDLKFSLDGGATYPGRVPGTASGSSLFWPDVEITGAVMVKNATAGQNISGVTVMVERRRHRWQ